MLINLAVIGTSNISTPLYFLTYEIKPMILKIMCR